MFKKCIPFAHAKNIYEIDINFYKKFNIKYIFADLDNTLDSYKQELPNKNAFDLKAKLEKEGIKLIIASNNRGPRVSKYALGLGVDYFSSVGKPFSKGLISAMKKHNINPNEACLIGDQTGTDIPCGNGAKVMTVLVDKLVKEDQPTTRINRLFDIPMRKHLARKNKLRDWKTLL